MSISKKDNALLHLAVVVGYARAGLSMARRDDTADAMKYAMKHLSLSDFAGLSQRSLEIAEIQIADILKDQCMLPEQGKGLIADVIAHNYSQCWRWANTALRMMGYDRVDPVELKPEWLA